MGWTYFQKPENVSKWFSDQLTWETEKTKNTCLKTAIKFKEAYAAVETIEKETGKREVWAAAFLLNYTRDSYYNFGYKDMDETMGPYIYNCPASILNLLTPTENETANKWREMCKQRAEKGTVKIGDTVKFNEPVSGGQDTFTKIKYGKMRNIFKNPTGGLHRLPKWVFEAYQWEYV